MPEFSIAMHLIVGISQKNLPQPTTAMPLELQQMYRQMCGQQRPLQQQLGQHNHSMKMPAQQQSGQHIHSSANMKTQQPQPRKPDVLADALSSALSETLGLDLTFGKTASSSPAPGPAPTNSQMSAPAGRGPSAWAIDDGTRSRYVGVFRQHCRDANGYMKSPEAIHVLSLSQLPQPVLAAVWTLADNDKDGKLSFAEFCVAMHLCVCVGKRGMQMPSVLPPELAVEFQRR